MYFCWWLVLSFLLFLLFSPRMRLWKPTADQYVFPLTASLHGPQSTAFFLHFLLLGHPVRQYHSLSLLVHGGLFLGRHVFTPLRLGRTRLVLWWRQNPRLTRLWSDKRVQKQRLGALKNTEQKCNKLKTNTEVVTSQKHLYRVSGNETKGSLWVVGVGMITRIL